MSKRKGKGNRTRDATTRDTPKNASLGLWLASDNDRLCVPGYIPLSRNPEVVAAVNRIASLIGSMTIHLMANTENGDARVTNGLSRMVDITPNRYMTRMTLMAWIVRTLMLDGDGNCVVWPYTRGGYLTRLEPVTPGRVAFARNAEGFGYTIRIDGQPHDPEDALHFLLNPDELSPWMGTGFRVSLGGVVRNLAQAARTKEGFMESKWKPSLVVRVESDAEELSTAEGRKKLADQYLSAGTAGEPWLIPAELMDVQQVKPLSLSDLAINEAVTLDRKTVAAILGVPPYVVGAGDFNRDEWNAFVQTTILPIVTGIQQELTRKLIRSDGMYFRLNPWSLYSYDISTLASIGGNLFVRGIMTGNEVRSWIGQGPLPGLDKLTILENYIPLDRIGDQLKLGGDSNGQN